MNKTKRDERDVVLEYKTPEWLEKDFLLSFRSGMAHFFIFHGDTDGLVMNPNCMNEPENAYLSFREFLRQVFDERQIVITYDVSSGIRFLTREMEEEFMKLAGIEQEANSGTDPVAAAKAGLAKKRGLPQDPNSCLPLTEKVLYKAENVAVIIKSAHFVAPNPGVNAFLPANERVNVQALRNWSQSQTMRARNNIVVLITDDITKVSPELRSGGSGAYQVFIPKPNKEERIGFIFSATAKSREKQKLEKELSRLRAQAKKIKDRGEMAQKQEEFDAFGPAIILPPNFEVAQFAHASQGMSFRQMQEIFLQTIKTGEELSLGFVRERKKRILNEEYRELMEIVEPILGFENIGGLDYIKIFFKEVLEAIRSGEARLVPMGVLLMGPPGTGKTAIVEALAKEAAFNFIKTKNIRSMWVGESEARMQRFIYALRSLAPVVVMNDEADLADAQRDAPKGDSGVSEHLMKMWMEFLSDQKIRGQVIVISCTNRPDRMDAALKRSGRADQRILVPMPSVTELPVIFEVMFKRYSIPTPINNFTSFAQRANGLSGADIEMIVLAAFRFAGGKPVGEKELNEAIDDFIPSASQATIDSMTMAGLLESSSRRLLPPNAKTLVQKIIERNLIENLDYCLTQIKTRKIVDL